MCDVDRYETIILTAIEIEQKKHELKSLMRTLSQVLTVNESGSRDFSRESADKAWFIVKSKSVIEPPAEYKRYEILKYKDVQFVLSGYQESIANGREVMKKILEGIKTADIFDAGK